MADFVEDVLRPVVVSLTLRSFHSLVGSKTEQDVWMVRGGPGSEHGPSSGGLLCPVVRAVPAAGPGVEAPGQAGPAHAGGHRGQGTAWLPPLLLGEGDNLKKYEPPKLFEPWNLTTKIERF